MGVDVYTSRRAQLSNEVARALTREGFDCQAVIEAIRNVPREKFVSDSLRHLAYENAPLPIGHGQTISQPVVVALMIAELQPQPQHKILDIGTGSGYAAAVLAELVDEVYTVERYPSLAERAQQRFHELGYDNIHVRHGDGREGWGEHAPYDGIVVAAASCDVPPALLRQLRVGGRLVLPVAEATDHHEQRLMSFQRVAEDKYRSKGLGEVQFVPLADGAAPDSPREVF